MVLKTNDSWVRGREISLDEWKGGKGKMDAGTMDGPRRLEWLGPPTRATTRRLDSTRPRDGLPLSPFRPACLWRLARALRLRQRTGRHGNSIQRPSSRPKASESRCRLGQRKTQSKSDAKDDETREEGQGQHDEEGVVTLRRRRRTPEIDRSVARMRCSREGTVVGGVEERQAGVVVVVWAGP